MTAGWAALNTLDKCLREGRLGLASRDRFDEAKDALALVQTALEAAERFAGRIDAPEYLREALRAVREGK